MQNRFEQFSQNIIAMHTGSAGAFDPARMMFPPEEKEASSQEMQNLHMTNVYRIQNLTEENYLYRQNFQFLTQMFEKQIHKKLYPQVERQVEKTIRQELPKAEDPGHPRNDKRTSHTGERIWCGAAPGSGKRSKRRTEGAASED